MANGSNSEAHLSVAGLRKQFGAVPVVDDISFSVGEGEIFALLGPSGCGKTTCLRTIAGFTAPDSGTINLAGRSLLDPLVPPEKRGIGFVFQDYALFPHLTVEQNISFGLANTRWTVRKARVQAMIRLVGLHGLGERYPSELSGGQQQRVAIARTLAPSPRLILLDEPFSNLDALLRETTRLEIRSMLKEAGQTVVLVTHDQEEALSFADRVAVMHNGRIEQVGTPEEIYQVPRTLFVAQFLGRTNLMLSTASGRVADTPIGRVDLNREAHGPVLLSLRPEQMDLAVAADTGRPNGRVAAREFKGHDITYRVVLAGAEYVVHTPARVQFQPGDQVSIHPCEPAVVLERGDD